MGTFPSVFIRGVIYPPDEYILGGPEPPGTANLFRIRVSRDRPGCVALASASCNFAPVYPEARYRRAPPSRRRPRRLRRRPPPRRAPQSGGALRLLAGGAGVHHRRHRGIGHPDPDRCQIPRTPGRRGAAWMSSCTAATSTAKVIASLTFFF